MKKVLPFRNSLFTQISARLDRDYRGHFYRPLLFPAGHAGLHGKGKRHQYLRLSSYAELCFSADSGTFSASARSSES